MIIGSAARSGRRVSLGVGLDGVDRLVESAAGERRTGDARHVQLSMSLPTTTRGDAADELAWYSLAVGSVACGVTVIAVILSSARVSSTVTVCCRRATGSCRRRCRCRRCSGPVLPLPPPVRRRRPLAHPARAPISPRPAKPTAMARVGRVSWRAPVRCGGVRSGGLRRALVGVRPAWQRRAWAKP